MHVLEAQAQLHQPAAPPCSRQRADRKTKLNI
jgi:hypothetical protein